MWCWSFLLWSLLTSYKLYTLDNIGVWVMNSAFKSCEMNQLMLSAVWSVTEFSRSTGNQQFSLLYSVSYTCCNHTCIIQMVSSQHSAFKKWLSCHVSLPNNADFYFCYVIKNTCYIEFYTNKNVTALPRCTRACLLLAINLSPATSFFGEEPCC